VAVTARVYIGRLARWLWPGDPLDPTALALTWTGAVLGVLACVAAVPLLPPAARVLPVLLFVCLGPGTAVVSRVRLGDAVAAWALTLVLSLSTVAALAACMAWLRVWYPSVGMVLLGLATAAASVPLLVRRRWWPPVPAAPPADATAVMPRVLDAAAPDVTSVMPAISGTPPDVTGVLPAFVEGAPPATAGGRLVAGERRVATKGWPVAGNRPADETAVLPVIRDDGELVGGDGRTLAETVLRDEPFGPEPGPGEPSGGPEGPAPGAARPASAAAWEVWLTPRSLAGILPLIAGLALWVVSLALSGTARVGDYGLLSVMHPDYFVAAALCAAGFVIELYRRAPRWPVLVGYVVLLLLILHATVPVLVREPEYAWTYKHIGVIEYIRAHGAVDNPADIYLQWPVLFALGAQVVAVTGISGLALSAWAPLFFDALNCLPLFAIARTLSPDRRVPFLTVFLFTAINWVAQDYLSPQAFTFVLCLGTLMIMLRWLRRVPGPAHRRPPRVIARLWAWLQNGLVEVPYSSTRTRNLALGALYFVYAVVAASHQLSPYIIALGATGLVVLGLIQPLRVVPILLGIAVLYLLPRHQVADNYGLFNGFNFFHNAQGNGPVLGTTAGRVFSSHVVQLMAIEVWGLAGLAVLDSRKRLGLVAVPAVLGFTPFALLLAQSYGGEAIYRVYLFAAPWCAYLIASMVLRWGWMPRAAGIPVATVALTGAMLACVQGAHGQLMFNQFTPDEVRAASYVYGNAPPNSAIVLAEANFPTRLSARYPVFAGGPNSDLNLVDHLDLVGHPLDGADLLTIEGYFRSLAPEPAFLVISPSMAHFAHFFGYLPDGAMDNLRATVAKSPNFTVYYQNRDAVVYRFVG
jgi:hypothetical protein